MAGLSTSLRDGTATAELSTSFRGEIAVAKVILRALEKGIAVFRPIVECRYDLILDDGRRLYRAQVKYGNGTSRLSQGAVTVGLHKWTIAGRHRSLYYTSEEIDVLLVYVPKTDRVLWFGPEVFDGRKKLQIRIAPARNNQARGCLMAD
jgi:hypothetical protein